MHSSLFVIFTWILTLGFPAFSQEVEGDAVAKGQKTLKTKKAPRFDAHLAGDPITVGHFKFNLEPNPSDPIEARTSVFASTFAIGLGESFEIGTVPISYVFQNKYFRTWNVTMKYNLYRSPSFALAIGYSHTKHYLKLEPALKDSEPSQEPEFVIRKFSNNGLGILTALRVSSRITAGLTLTGTRFYTGDATRDRTVNKLAGQPEAYLDACYRFAPRWSLTMGSSHSHYLSEESIESDAQLGYGASFTWHRPKSFISKPSLGFHHLSETRRNLYLISTTFY